jgi:hypothetical protein
MAGEMTVETSVARGNGAAGLLVQDGGTGRVSNSVFTDNQWGLYNNASMLESRGNNTVRGNVNLPFGTIRSISGTWAERSDKPPRRIRANAMRLVVDKVFPFAEARAGLPLPAVGDASR